MLLTEDHDQEPSTEGKTSGAFARSVLWVLHSSIISRNLPRKAIVLNVPFDILHITLHDFSLSLHSGFKVERGFLPPDNDNRFLYVFSREII
jgi:hypothetical protein